jgi:hypothetical protein
MKANKRMKMTITHTYTNSWKEYQFNDFHHVLSYLFHPFKRNVDTFRLHTERERDNRRGECHRRHSSSPSNFFLGCCFFFLSFCRLTKKGKKQKERRQNREHFSRYERIDNLSINSPPQKKQSVCIGKRHPHEFESHPIVSTSKSLYGQCGMAD